MQSLAAFAEDFVLLGTWKHKEFRFCLFGFSKHCFVAETKTLALALFQALYLAGNITAFDRIILLDFNERLPPYKPVVHHIRGHRAKPNAMKTASEMGEVFDKSKPVQSNIGINTQLYFGDDFGYLGQSSCCKCPIHDRVNSWAKEKKTTWLKTFQQDTKGAICTEEFVWEPQS